MAQSIDIYASTLHQFVTPTPVVGYEYTTSADQGYMRIFASVLEAVRRLP